MIYLNTRENGDEAERNHDPCGFYITAGLIEHLPVVAFPEGESMHVYSDNTEVSVWFEY